MKYRRLTKEQFESLDKEFAQFLATQKIDKDQWNEIKINKPELVEEELSIFSDMVWEDVLSKVNYLEHISKNSMNLFKIHQQSMERIVVKLPGPAIKGNAKGKTVAVMSLEPLSR